MAWLLQRVAYAWEMARLVWMRFALCGVLNKCFREKSIERKGNMISYRASIDDVRPCPVDRMPVQTIQELFGYTATRVGIF